MQGIPGSLGASVPEAEPAA